MQVYQHPEDKTHHEEEAPYYPETDLNFQVTQEEDGLTMDDLTALHSKLTYGTEEEEEAPKHKRCCKCKKTDDETAIEKIHECGQHFICQDCFLEVVPRDTCILCYCSYCKEPLPLNTTKYKKYPCGCRLHLVSCTFKHKKECPVCADELMRRRVEKSANRVITENELHDGQVLLTVQQFETDLRADEFYEWSLPIFTFFLSPLLKLFHSLHLVTDPRFDQANLDDVVERLGDMFDPRPFIEKTGYNMDLFLASDVTLHWLFEKGFNLNHLYEMGLEPHHLRNKKLRDFTTFKKMGLSPKAFNEMGYTKQDYENAGYSVNDFQTLKFNMTDLLDAGYGFELLEDSPFYPFEYWVALGLTEHNLEVLLDGDPMKLYTLQEKCGWDLFKVMTEFSDNDAIESLCCQAEKIAETFQHRAIRIEPEENDDEEIDRTSLESLKTFTTTDSEKLKKPLMRV